MRHFLYPLALLGLAAVPCLSAGSEQFSVRSEVESGRLKPLVEILRSVEQQFPGRVLEVEMENDRALGAIYEITVLDAQNRKREIKVNARSGALLELDNLALHKQSQLKPLPEILRNLLAQFPGHISEVEYTQGDQGHVLYEVSIKTHAASELELLVDARTGEVVNGLPQPEEQAPSLMPLPDILEALLLQRPGLVLEAELEHDRNSRPDRFFYEIELRLDNGQELELMIDAQTGQTLHERISD